jgi:hypothetical protein
VTIVEKTLLVRSCLITYHLVEWAYPIYEVSTRMTGSELDDCGVSRAAALVGCSSRPYQT